MAGQAVHHLEVSPSGRLVVGDNHVDHAGRAALVLPDAPSDYAEAVTALSWSPDGTTLVVGGSAGALQLRDTATQQPLAPAENVDTNVFSRGSRTLYAGSAHAPLQRYVVAQAEPCPWCVPGPVMAT
ncbi:hypothetical protein [Streptomyces sp. MBT33]|uniref:WD40 domain-containing protein n=1 Tax=Streptomyces sp. MBT33 TaxID=1488363 RepID=UPI00190E3189|nr:hypothetical protein [Streptomyces sp. MBT33]MBK3642532.1 hypothetical protein [Streptomyces sp. MBT33]